MNTKSKFGILLLIGVVAGFFGISLAQDGSNAWYILGVAGLLALIIGAVKLMGGTNQDR